MYVKYIQYQSINYCGYSTLFSSVFTMSSKTAKKSEVSTSNAVKKVYNYTLMYVFAAIPW